LERARKIKTGVGKEHCLSDGHGSKEKVGEKRRKKPPNGGREEDPLKRSVTTRGAPLKKFAKPRGRVTLVQGDPHRKLSMFEHNG